MTQMIFDKKPDDDKDQDRMDHCPACRRVFPMSPLLKILESGERFDFRIPLTEQYPKEEDATVLPFVIDGLIYLPRFKPSFRSIANITANNGLQLFLKQVVIRLFENLDYSYAHMSVMKKLRVRLSC